MGSDISIKALRSQLPADAKVYGKTSYQLHLLMFVSNWFSSFLHDLGKRSALSFPFLL